MTTQAHPCRRPGPKVAPMGALSLAILRLEVRRLLRNRRTMISTLIMPVIFFLIFGMNSADAGLSAGHGNVSAFIMISLALYGAILATASGAAMVSVERAAGWSRQLRLTPLSPSGCAADTVCPVGGTNADAEVGRVRGRPS